MRESAEFRDWLARTQTTLETNSIALLHELNGDALFAPTRLHLLRDFAVFSHDESRCVVARSVTQCLFL